jgi:hypothetical protein
MNSKPVPDQETGTFRLHNPYPDSDLDLTMSPI